MPETVLQSEPSAPEAPSPPRSGPDPVDDSQVLDWDATIEAPPPKRSGTIRVRLVYAGRGKPEPVEDPWAP